MSDKYVVPEAGLKAAEMTAEAVWALKGTSKFDAFRAGVREFVRWQSENPPVPTDEQIREAAKKADPRGDWKVATSFLTDYRNFLMLWERIMYLAPEPTVPEEIEDLLHNVLNMEDNDCNRRIVEAFRRGQKAGTK